MIKYLKNIKNLINTFIDEELIIDHTQFIYTHVFFEQLEIYFNKNNIKFNKNSLKNQIVICLSLKLGIENYKSSFKHGSRVYTKLKFKSTSILNISSRISLKDYNLLKKEINLLQIDVTRVISNYLEMVTAYRNVISQLETKVEILETKYLELSKSTEVLEKDDNYTL